MKNADVVIGGTYEALVSGRLQTVRIVGTFERSVRVRDWGGVGWREGRRIAWRGINPATRREILIRSAQRLRKRIDDPVPLTLEGSGVCDDPGA